MQGVINRIYYTLICMHKLKTFFFAKIVTKYTRIIKKENRDISKCKKKATLPKDKVQQMFLCNCDIAPLIQQIIHFN